MKEHRTRSLVPGLLLSFDQADDVLHPQHQVAHHAKEAELVSGVHQLSPPAFHCCQQVLPGLQDLQGNDSAQSRVQESCPGMHAVRTHENPFMVPSVSGRQICCSCWTTAQKQGNCSEASEITGRARCKRTKNCRQKAAGFPF